VNPITHTVLNYTAYVPSTSIFAFIKGNSTVYTLGNEHIQAIEFKNESELIISSINNVILEKKVNNETIRLVFANYSKISNEKIPNLYKLAERVNLLNFDSYTVIGILVSVILFIILRRFK
jgi:hypothetical protein